MVQGEKEEAEASNKTFSGPPSYKSREEYLEKLKQWLEEARLWHGFCMNFPYYVNPQPQNGASTATWTSAGYQELPYQTNNRGNNNVNPPLSRQPVFRPGTYEFVVPPLWKRVIAEVMDFFILLILKMVLTFLVLETFYIVIENYRFDSFMKNIQDPKLAMQMSVEILTLELLHRFIVCCYEVYWLKGGPCATPGKRYMGLIVIQVENVIPVAGRADEVVRISQFGPLGLHRAIIRAVLKNIFLGIMLPICFTMYIFRFNRTGYDAVTGSMVVEFDPNMQPVQ